MNLKKITDTLIKELRPLSFSQPVSHVYNPLEYARKPYDAYLRKYGTRPKEVLLVGMNPGPWGMVQTGIPFGEIEAVTKWLKIKGPVGQPLHIHPKRPVEGFACKRREVSGKRLWGWAEKRFQIPERFFERFFVANYCPLMFIEQNGRNRTPNQIHTSERRPLLEVCDRALRNTALFFKPRFVIGIGEFTAGRIQSALSDQDMVLGRITHPSPANPRANRGWEACIMEELSQMGIRI